MERENTSGENFKATCLYFSEKKQNYMEYREEEIEMPIFKDTYSDVL